jgi:16S rRNA (guanine527-N7)-methyltransferase
VTNDSSPLLRTDLVETGLAELAVSASDQTVDSLVKLALLVEAWGRRINLSGHRDADTITRRLVLDAAALMQLLPPALSPTPPQCQSLADLGSGAGFPGLPIAILRPELEVVLVETRERRHHFQRYAIRELGLANVRAIRGRFEEIEPVRCHAVVAQAVAAPGDLVDWMLRWALPGASLIVPGGTFPRSAGTPGTRAPGLSGSRGDHYQVPLGGPSRSVWIGIAL